MAFRFEKEQYEKEEEYKFKFNQVDYLRITNKSLYFGLEDFSTYPGH